MFTLFALVLSTSAWAGSPAPVAVPAPAACAVLADKFTVLDISRCRGCVTKHVIAEVWASRCTTESCASAQEVAQIRCERGQCGSCESEKYVKELIVGLASPSHRVRAASRRSLKVCDLVVDGDRVCVRHALPKIVLY